jgi:hypothetical protein
VERESLVYCRCQQLGRSKIMAHRQLRLSWQSELRKKDLEEEPNQLMIEQAMIEGRQTALPGPDAVSSEIL